MEQVDNELLEITALHLAGYDNPAGQFTHVTGVIFDPIQLDLMKNLYITGGRYADIALRSSIITAESEYTVFQASKGGDQFTVDNSLLSAYFLSQIQSDDELYPTARYGSLRFWVARALLPWRYTLNEKNIGVHLFRYAFITRKHNEGYTDEQISSMIGEKTPATTREYYMQPIYREVIQF